MEPEDEPMEGEALPDIEYVGDEAGDGGEGDIMDLVEEEGDEDAEITQVRPFPFVHCAVLQCYFLYVLCVRYGGYFMKNLFLCDIHIF